MYKADLKITFGSAFSIFHSSGKGGGRMNGFRYLIWGR